MPVAPESRDNTQLNWKKFVARVKDPELGIPNGDRKWMFKVHKNCFSGREAVQWFMENIDLENR